MIIMENNVCQLLVYRNEKLYDIKHITGSYLVHHEPDDVHAEEHLKIIIFEDDQKKIISDILILLLMDFSEVLIYNEKDELEDYWFGLYKSSEESLFF